MTHADKEDDKDVIQYALRRLDTGEFYWTPRIPRFHKPPKTDPRWRNWTPDMNKAKLYSWRGVKSLAGLENAYHKKYAPLYQVEVIKVKLVIDKIIPIPSGTDEKNGNV